MEPNEEKNVIRFSRDEFLFITFFSNRNRNRLISNGGGIRINLFLMQIKMDLVWVTMNEITYLSQMINILLI